MAYTVEACLWHSRHIITNFLILGVLWLRFFMSYHGNEVEKSIRLNDLQSCTVGDSVLLIGLPLQIGLMVKARQNIVQIKTLGKL